MKLVNKKNIYMLFLFVVCLLMIVVVPTYAKFGSSYATSDDVATFALDFDVSITDIDEYEELVIAAGEKYKFNIKVTNNADVDVYYGMWYRMVEPRTLSNNISIGRLNGVETATSGSIAVEETKTVTIAIINNSDKVIKVDIGVATSEIGISDIEYLDGRYLINKDVSIPRDIMISSITIDGVVSDSLPTSGYYEMSYNCSKGSKLDWEPLSKSLIYKEPSYMMDECNLNFTSSKSADVYPKLNKMAVGSYVAYVGTGGVVGSNNVSCKKDATSSSAIATDETEAPNSCSGQNAREDLDTSGYTYGYCSDANYKYYVTGWRIAYIDDNGKAIIVSAGSPECNNRISEDAIESYNEIGNTKALKYCNKNYVDGDCVCVDNDADGLCDSASTDAWAISDKDFYYMTKAISGYGKRLSAQSSTLGDNGGKLGSTLYCENQMSYQECGYSNDLIDNGGYYLFASNVYDVFWNPSLRSIASKDYFDVLGLRPVISLSSDVYVTGGTGTMNDPYTISK